MQYAAQKTFILLNIQVCKSLSNITMSKNTSEVFCVVFLFDNTMYTFITQQYVFTTIRKKRVRIFLKNLYIQFLKIDCDILVNMCTYLLAISLLNIHSFIKCVNFLYNTYMYKGNVLMVYIVILRSSFSTLKKKRIGITYSLYIMLS